jgi:hypothetical protein
VHAQRAAACVRYHHPPSRCRRASGGRGRLGEDTQSSSRYRAHNGPTPPCHATDSTRVWDEQRSRRSRATDRSYPRGITVHHQGITFITRASQSSPSHHHRSPVDLLPDLMLRDPIVVGDGHKVMLGAVPRVLGREAPVTVAPQQQRVELDAAVALDRGGRTAPAVMVEVKAPRGRRASDRAGLSFAGEGEGYREGGRSEDEKGQASPVGRMGG